MPHVRIALVGFAVLVLVSQSARAEDKPADKPASQPAKAQPVDFHKLVELMPEEAVGVKRSDANGQNINAGTMAMSTATADYTKPDSDGSDAHAAIQIADYGAAPEMVAGMTAWRTVPINVESDDGYQRTVKLKDYPAFETYSKSGGDARQMILLVADRFMVTIDTTHVSEADFKKLVEGLPLDKLATLK